MPMHDIFDCAEKEKEKEKKKKKSKKQKKQNLKFGNQTIDNVSQV